MSVISKIKSLIFRYRLAKANPAQKAELMRPRFYHLGKNVKLYTSSFGTEPYLISIHDNVTCAANVHFINHDVSCFNIARFLGIDLKEIDKVGPITLFENAFVGAFSILMPGCSVGRNSVIAAGSIVTKQVPDNQVWGGTGQVYHDYGGVCQKAC